MAFADRERAREWEKRKKKKENKHTGRRTTLTRTVAAADLHTGEGCRSRVEGKERTRQGSQLAQAGAVEFSTVIGTSLCMLQHHHHQHHLHGEPPGIHRGLSRDGLKMYVSSYPFASFAFSSHLAIHPHIHPSMNPSAPLRSRRPAQRIYIIAVMLRFSGWATRSGHHRQNYLLPIGRRGRGQRASSTRINVISHVRKLKRERKSLFESWMRGVKGVLWGRFPRLFPACAALKPFCDTY